MAPSGIEPANFRFVAQHLNHCAPAVHRWASKTTRSVLSKILDQGLKNGNSVYKTNVERHIKVRRMKLQMIYFIIFYVKLWYESELS
jgi:hypothetical protein